jgi:hypothetical protein
MSLHRTIKAHFIHTDKGVMHKAQIEHAPSVGDELRFSGERYYKVTLLVWVFDEPEAQFTRLNVGITEVK